MSSVEMNMMAMTMPSAPQGPVGVRICCFEATPANLATLRKLKSTAAAGERAVSLDDLIDAGMKATELSAGLSTTVKEILSLLRSNESAGGEEGSGPSVALFALSRTAKGPAEDAMIPLTDKLIVEALVECPQIGLHYRNTVAGEVCVGTASNNTEAAATSSSAPSLVLFYSRDTALGCSNCCLCACCAAICATICCCCMMDDE